MGIIVNWAAFRGLNLTEQLLRDALGLPNFQEVVSEKLDIINQKLDILIESPFRQARMHLLEGNIEKCKDKLIESISLNELDLPALALYSLLLYKSGNIPLALDYFEEIIRKFGPHSELISDKIVEVCKQYINEDKPLQNIQPFQIQNGDWTYYPAEVYCTLSSISINWKPRKGYESSGGGTYSPPTIHWPIIIVYDWTGREITEIQNYGRSIVAFTDEYLVFSYDKGFFSKKTVIEIFRMKDGSKLSVPFTVSAQQVAKLFRFDKSFTLKTLCSENSSIKFSFAGAEINTAEEGRWIQGHQYKYHKVHIKPE